MILWPSIASGLLPLRCVVRGDAQETTFAAVFAFKAGKEMPEDNSSARVKRKESADGTQEAQIPPVPWMVPPIENIVTPQGVDHTNAAEPADKGFETPRLLFGDGDAMVSGADLTQGTVAPWPADAASLESPVLSDPSPVRQGQGRRNSASPTEIPLSLPVMVPEETAAPDQPPEETTGLETGRNASPLPAEREGTAEISPSWYGLRVERPSLPPNDAPAEGNAAEQLEPAPTIPSLLTAPQPWSGQTKTRRDARTIRDVIQDVPPDAEALPKPSRFAAEASRISERASPKDLSILPSSARNLSFADETETQISGGHSPFIAAPFIEQAPALAASALGRTSAFAAVQPESAVAESTRAILRQIVGKDGAAVEIALFPKELGQIRLQIEQSPEGARILVTAERAEIAALIRHHAAELAQEFRSTGMSNPMITVQSGDPSRDNRGDGSGSNAPFTQAPIQSESGQSGQMTGNHSGDRAAPQPGSQPLHPRQEQVPSPTDAPPSNPPPGLTFPTEGGLILRL